MLQNAKEDFEFLKNIFQNPQNIVILSHYNPDGDALGSSLSLYHLLKQLGHQVQVIYPSAYPPYFNWMPSIEKTLFLDANKKNEIEKSIKDAAVILNVDFNAKKRIQDLEPFFDASKGIKIAIDHHESPTYEDFDTVFCNSKSSSACEVVYEIIEKLNLLDLINYEVATCLFTGLITDTGGFQYASTAPYTHQMAAFLIEKGASSQDIFDLSFNNFSLNRLKLFGYCTSNCLKISDDQRIAYQWIDHNTKNKFQIKEGDTESLVNQPMKISTVKVSVLFKEDKDKIRISFRSKGDIDVNTFARTYFEGGGHKNAAGGSSKKTLTDTLSYFESLIAQL